VTTSSPVVSTLSELLIDRPLIIFFGNGDTVHGTMIVNSRTRSRSLPPLDYKSLDWSGVDLSSEIPATADRKGIGLSVQERLENYVKNRPRRGRHWCSSRPVCPFEVWKDSSTVHRRPAMRTSVASGTLPGA
jgi:hypothetical protein